MYNEQSMTTVCGTLCYAMGIEPPEYATETNPALKAYIDEKLGGKKADRILMFNPDAVAEWIYRKYPYLTKEVQDRTEVEVPLCTVMPSVTPVCFATMYSGATPKQHGIRKYEKPVLTVDTFFDALLRAGKKPAIIAVQNCSIARIFLERGMDYYIFPNLHEEYAKAAELILRDEYDVIVFYDGSYDSRMHKVGPEGLEALADLKANSRGFAWMSELVKTAWKGHDTLVAWAMDHGCHEIDGELGSHGLDMEEDLNVVHRYQIYPAEK